MTELRRATELEPKRATFHSNLAHALTLRASSTRRVASAKKATALDPKLGSAWLNLGTASAKKGDYAAAEQAFKRAQALDPTDPRPKTNLDELEELEKTAPR